MNRLLLGLAITLVAGCQTPMPVANPQMAWVDFSTPFPNDRVLMAERLINSACAMGGFSSDPGSS